MSSEHLILAGGGHSHALALLRWVMSPNSRPDCLITLINRTSTSLYSGMLPGIVAGRYQLDEAQVNLRELASKANVVFIKSEIKRIDLSNNTLILEGRSPVKFTRLSIDIGSQIADKNLPKEVQQDDHIFPIKPLEAALDFIISQDSISSLNQEHPFTVIGSGLAAIEIAFALRERWPMRPLQLQAYLTKQITDLKEELSSAAINLISTKDVIEGPALKCTGSCAPKWLKESGLAVDSSGRVLTTKTFQVRGHSLLFAVGDCGVIQDSYRPPSGVWAVRAAVPLAKNLERSCKGLKPLQWRPQRQALQLMGGVSKTGNSVAWAFWGDFVFGPHSFLWYLKESIDRSFMAKFDLNSYMHSLNKRGMSQMRCRGCAAKLPAEPLKKALELADLQGLGQEPQDATLIGPTENGRHVFQSVDGFPALVSDPWLNGRLTTLHACSDLWATGVRVTSAQAVITLPPVPSSLQQELLTQCLGGIQSALSPQGACLVGGHTLEARDFCGEEISLGVQIALSVNGILNEGHTAWSKSGLQLGDDLLISRALGTGVIFAAFMADQVDSKIMDNALSEMSTSQHVLLEDLLKVQYEDSTLRPIHACTDITGFGLLGHLGEMLGATNSRRRLAGLSGLKIKLFANSIPAMQGAFRLFKKGIFSTLAPDNRSAWKFLQSGDMKTPQFELNLGDIANGSEQYKSIMELIVDPQTCGPLAIFCSAHVSDKLVRKGPWQKIGKVCSH